MDNGRHLPTALIILFITIVIVWLNYPSNKHYHGNEFKISYPSNWSYAKFNSADLQEMGATFILAPKSALDVDGNIVTKEKKDLIFLTIGSKYIESKTDQVESYEDWSRLQFADSEYTVKSISSENILNEPVTRVIYYRDENKCDRYISNAYYFNRYLEDSANNRLTFSILVFMGRVDRELMEQGMEIQESMKVSSFRWDEGVRDEVTQGK